MTNYADVETGLIDLVGDLASAGVATPPDLETSLPFVRVHRIGGPDDGVTDHATVVIDCFASSRALVLELAETVRQLIITPGAVVPGVLVIDQARALTGPSDIPWSDSQSVRRFSATYQVNARRL